MADYCLEELLQIHKSQLKASAVPEVFYARLFGKTEVSTKYFSQFTEEV